MIYLAVIIISNKSLVVINLNGAQKACNIFVLAALLTFITGCAGLVHDPAAEQAAEQIEQETSAALPEPIIDPESEEEANSNMVASGNNQKLEEPVQPPGSPTPENSEPVVPPVKETMPLLLDLTEISLEAYLEVHGLEDKKSHPVTAAATRIGKATVNPLLFARGSISAGDTVSFRLFDNVQLKFTIKSHTSGCPATFNGDAENGGVVYLYAIISGNTLMATLEAVDRNQIYLLRYSPKTGSPYLFLAPLQGLDVLEDSPPLIAPGTDQ